MSTRELVSLPPILPFSPDPSHPHGDGFYFGIQFQCVVTHLAVVAAEGQCGVEDVVAVDPDFHRCCDDVLMARRDSGLTPGYSAGSTDLWPYHQGNVLLSRCAVAPAGR